MLKDTTYTVTRGSTGEQIREKLYNADGTVMTLAGCTVQLRMLHPRSLAVVAAFVATIEDALLGIVNYTWQAADWTALPDERYIRKWRITKPSSAVVFVPSDRDGYETRIIAAGN